MNLEQSLAQTSSVLETNVCKVGQYLELAKEKGEFDLMQEILNTYSRSRASVILSRAGYPVGPTAIGNHKTESCGCYK